MDMLRDVATDDKNKCSCGREHKLITKEIYIGTDALDRLIKFIDAEFGEIAKGVIICDENTHRAAEKLISGLSQKCVPVILSIDSCHADLAMVDAAKEKIKDLGDFDFLIAAGSGTIHDITRVLAENMSKPFISFPTAPSVDGFISNVAPVTVEGMKITLQAVSPIALFADSKIICAAPKRLTASGAGDILGKYISLADWKVANLLTGEYICDRIVGLQYAAANRVRDSLASLSNGTSYEILCVELLEALIISGACMQLIGISRPASGAEHHIAHFFEMGVLVSFDGLHGENVGLGSIFCSDIYHRFAQTPDTDIIFAHESKAYELEHDLIKAYYKDLYDEIIKQNTPNELIKITPEIFYANLGELKEILAEIPTKSEFIELLNAVSGVTDLNHFGVDNADAVEKAALKLAPYIRNRLTFLKLCRLIELNQE